MCENAQRCHKLLLKRQHKVFTCVKPINISHFHVFQKAFILSNIYSR